MFGLDQLLLKAAFLALASQGSAQGSGTQCLGPSITITDDADASSLSSCLSYRGDIIISELVEGEISLDGVKEITGDLRCENATQITSIAADKLTTIGGNFVLTDVALLSTLAFSSLTSVNEVSWKGLVSLQRLSFDQGVSQAGNVLISGTELNTLAGLSLQTVGDFNVNNNRALSLMNLSALSNITGSFNVEANSKDLSIDLTGLEQANNMTFMDVAEITAPHLSRVNGSLGLYGDAMSSLLLPSLIQTAGTMALVDCSSLRELSVPAMQEVGQDFTISNNTKLYNITLPQLTIVVGTLDFTGNFSTLSFPFLSDVQGDLNVQTSTAPSLCTGIEALKSSGTVKGTVTCADDQSNPNANSSNTSGAGSSPTSSSGGNPNISSGLSGGAIAGIVIGAIAGIAIAVLVLWCLRRQRKRQHAQLEKKTHPHRAELPLGHHHEKTELPSEPNHVSELTGDRTYTVQRGQGEESVDLDREQAGQHPPQNAVSGRISGPHELAWDVYEPAPDPSHGSTQHRASSGGEGSQDVSDLGTGGTSAELGREEPSIKRKPLERPTSPPKPG